MENVTTNQESMENHHDFGGIWGAIGSIVTIMFVTFPHKIAKVLLDTTTLINPAAKQFIIDIAPFIGAATGLLAMTMYFYRIKIYRKQLKEMDEKKKFQSEKEMD